MVWVNACHMNRSLGSEESRLFNSIFTVKPVITTCRHRKCSPDIVNLSAGSGRSGGAACENAALISSSVAFKRQSGCSAVKWPVAVEWKESRLCRRQCQRQGRNWLDSDDWEGPHRTAGARNSNTGDISGEAPGRSTCAVAMVDVDDFWEATLSVVCVHRLLRACLLL